MIKNEKLRKSRSIKPRATRRIPSLPKLLDRKIYKTGQTRGADDDVIFQNRVGRNSTVLFPYNCWNICSTPPAGEMSFESGFIVLISPNEYFNNPTIAQELAAKELSLGVNALVFYETRDQWNANNPDRLGWTAAQRRTGNLGGQYVARVPATTATDDGDKIIRGFQTTSSKGAGIRVYEYASNDTIKQCRLQLEALFWLCKDGVDVAVNNGMSSENATARKEYIMRACEEQGLLNFDQLIDVRILNATRKTICPLCLEELSSQGFFNRMEQAEGREVPDLTVTQLNLFHINELRVGFFNHCPYNLGWGHHHCNVVVKDSGIHETVVWMHNVVQRNIADGHFTPENNPN